MNTGGYDAQRHDGVISAPRAETRAIFLTARRFTIMSSRITLFVFAAYMAMQNGAILPVIVDFATSSIKMSAELMAFAGALM